MKYTRIPENTFKEIQLNAGLLCKNFTPSTGEVEDIIGASKGGWSFEATPSYSDFGGDVDNAPDNMAEMKKLTSWAAAMSGTFISINADTIKSLLGAADVSTIATAISKIVPRNDISMSDFTDLWWVGDYSDKNGSTNGGFIAIHLMNTLSTGGFQLKSSDEAKGEFAATFTAHYSMSAQDTVPFELYLKAGTDEAA